MQVVSDLIKNISLPKMVRVQQIYDNFEIAAADIPAIIRIQLYRDDLLKALKPGMKVAITCGSRGIHNYQLIVKTIVDLVKETRAVPFIVGAMGSHGGATEDGQRQILADFGITEQSMGCPIKCQMDTVHIGHCDKFGTDVRIDKNAAEADAILLLNRIKIHTSFHGPYESGLMKMMSIGLGKQPGAEIIHAVRPELMHQVIEEHGKIILQNVPVIGGLAIIENAYDKTYKIVGLTPNEIVTEEPRLLLEAKSLFATLPFDKTDILIIDKIGKNISGDGMDPNITGRFATRLSGGIDVSTIVVLDLTDETHGNAQGIGMADVTTKRLENKMKREITYPTAVTNKFLCLDKLPMVMDNDKEALQLAIRSIYAENSSDIKIIRIPDTAHLEYIEISEALLDEAMQNPKIKILSDAYDWQFDADGNLW